MFCKSCGQQIDNDSTCCSFCGIKQSIELRPQVQASENQSIKDTLITYNQEIALNNSPGEVRHIKYDPTYKKEGEILTTGITFLAITLIFALVGPVKFQDSESNGLFKGLLALGSLIFRIYSTGMVVDIAKRQNRDTIGWGFFAFILPSIALIVIGTRKKLFANIQIIEGLNHEQNSKIFSDKAQEFYKENKYSESIRFSKKAIELNPDNEAAKDIFKRSNVAFAEEKNISNSILTEFCETKDGQVLKIVSKFYQTIGAEVFIEDFPAPNGSYISRDNRKMIVENGKILTLKTITKFKKLTIEMSHISWPIKGDLVFLESGIPAPTGRYRQGFWDGSIIVQDGKFISW